MEILLVEGSGRGNQAHRSHGLSTGLAKLGHEVTLLTSSDYELSGEASGYALKYFGGTDPWMDGYRLVVEARRIDPDVVHVRWLPSPVVQLFAVVALRLLSDAPLVLTAPHVAPHGKRFYHEPFLKWTYRLFQAVITHSESNRSRLVDRYGLEPERVSVAPQVGVVPHRDADEDPGERSLLFFGYATREKGVETVLEAMEVLGEGYTLTIAGKGASRFSGANVRTVEGYVPLEDVAEYFGKHGLVVLPHLKRCTSPIVALAREVGRPVVASDRVENSGEATGITFEAGDPEDLARAVGSFYEGGKSLLEEAEASAGQTRRRAAEATEAVYRELLVST